jgi:hypothetical protein
MGGDMETLKHILTMWRFSKEKKEAWYKSVQSAMGSSLSYMEPIASSVKRRQPLRDLTNLMDGGADDSSEFSERDAKRRQLEQMTSQMELRNPANLLGRTSSRA